MLGFFALVALLMAALGLYVYQLLRDAAHGRRWGFVWPFGAQSASLLALVVGQGLRLAGIGVAVGLRL